MYSVSPLVLMTEQVPHLMAMMGVAGRVYVAVRMILSAAGIDALVVEDAIIKPVLVLARTVYF